jgi:hypothetical protein
MLHFNCFFKNKIIQFPEIKTSVHTSLEVGTFKLYL